MFISEPEVSSRVSGQLKAWKKAFVYKFWWKNCLLSSWIWIILTDTSLISKLMQAQKFLNETLVSVSVCHTLLMIKFPHAQEAWIDSHTQCLSPTCIFFCILWWLGKDANGEKKKRGNQLSKITTNKSSSSIHYSTALLFTVTVN